MKPSSSILLPAASVGPAVLVALVTPPAPIRTANFTSLVTFGDSFTDSGNVFRLTNGQYPPPAPLTDNGRHSNGLMWPEYLAKFLHADLPQGIPVHNFAYGGATSNDSLVQGYSPAGTTGRDRARYLATPGVDQQLTMFKLHLEASANASHFVRPLFVIWAGTWDLLWDSAAGNATPDRIVGNLMTAVGHLDMLAKQNAGVMRNGYDIVLMGLPPMDRLPLLKRMPSAARMFEELALRTNRIMYDRLAKSNVGREVARLPRIQFVDVHALLHWVVDSPDTYNFGTPKTPGLTVQDPCLMTDIRSQEVRMCAEPAAHVFWGDAWFSTRAHRILARAVAGVFGIYMEPLPKPGDDGKEKETESGSGGKRSEAVRPE
ncbi:hypothetical protein BCR44DRAFT_42970 [Catenaria anguillulae PL171]|uniref:GDSL lipase/esterase n=1 Tax=Catenaria anguillulae PL171 TaxID=765915 RepID=A0A1Y2HGQ5_9FUNG|nr:hypothetical protein BCR44DRAFT_42970 [Catenaria anguillulae PL171]